MSDERLTSKQRLASLIDVIDMRLKNTAPAHALIAPEDWKFLKPLLFAGLSTHEVRSEVASWLEGMHDYARPVDQPKLSEAAALLRAADEPKAIQVVERKFTDREIAALDGATIPHADYRDQLYALLLRRGLHSQDEAAEIAFGEGPRQKCDGHSCVHCEPEQGCSRPSQPPSALEFSLTRGSEVRELREQIAKLEHEKCQGCGAPWPMCVCPASDEISAKHEPTSNQLPEWGDPGQLRFARQLVANGKKHGKEMFPLNSDFLLWLLDKQLASVETGESDV